MSVLRMKLAFATLVLACAGCLAPVGSSLHVPEDAAVTCQDHCHKIGMELSAVAIMANNVGCVCQNVRQVARSGEREAVIAGMATIMLQEQDRKPQQ